MKNEISIKNEYYIPKYRYLELKYYCRQYRDWVKAYNDLFDCDSKSIIKVSKSFNVFKNHVADQAYMQLYLKNKIDQIHIAADIAWRDYHSVDLFFMHIFDGLSYDAIELKKGPLPVSRKEFYIRSRRFFYELDMLRS